MTEAVLLAATMERRDYGKFMNHLLDRHPEIQVTESILTAAVGCSSGYMGAMGSLLARGPDTKVTNPFKLRVETRVW